MPPLITRAGPTSAGMMTVDLGYGRANYSTSSSSFACLKVIAPFVRSSGATSGKLVNGTKSWQLAGPNQSFGGFSHSRVEHHVGTVLLFQGTRMSGGFPIAEGGIFLRLRESGPLYEVYGRLPTSPQNVIGDEVSLGTLRGDLLTLDDLKLVGIEVPRLWRQRFLQGDEIAEMLTVSELQPEIKPRPQMVAVATATGISVQEVAVAPSRRLRFRGGE